MGRFETQKRQRRIRGDKRTIPLRGTGEDAGKYYRCWNCGFTADKDRDELGNEESRSGVTHKDLNTPAYGAGSLPDTSVAVARLRGFRNATVALENDAEGSPKGVRHEFYVDGAGGCPFCHSKNYR